MAQRIGSFAATIDLGGDSSDGKLIDPIPFRVVPPSAESGAFWLNEKLLTEIADQSGGKYFRLEQNRSNPRIASNDDHASRIQQPAETTLGRQSDLAVGDVYFAGAAVVDRMDYSQVVQATLMGDFESKKLTI